MSQTRKPRWAIGDAVTAPVANTVLASKGITIGKRGYIMGYWISTTDPSGNTFVISWLHNGIAKQQIVVFGAQGTVKDSESDFALNEDFSADPQSNITVTCLNNGTVLTTYQASLLIAEESV